MFDDMQATAVTYKQKYTQKNACVAFLQNSCFAEFVKWKM